MSDQELVNQLLSGSEQAFDSFFNEYYPRLYRFVLRRCRETAVAEDIAQATLCRAIESMHTYKGEAALMTWLCTLCRREMSGRWNDRHTALSVSMEDDDPEIQAALGALLIAEVDDPLVAAVSSEVRETVLAALDYLPPLYAELLECKYVREMSVQTVAQKIGRTVKATESLLTRARDSFREAFTLLQADASRASK
ncbi:MAG: RNA polymerase sigma factor [Steroidobacter sp.]